MDIGYLASSNPPNYFAIKKLIKVIEKSDDIRLFIAGSICEMISELEIAKNVVLLGKPASFNDLLCFSNLSCVWILIPEFLN